MALELPKLKKKQGQSGKSLDLTSKVSHFFEKNPLMKIIIPVVLFIILVAVFLLVVFGDGILTDEDDGVVGNQSVQSDEVQVIPGSNIIKDKEVVKLIDNDPLSPDILAVAKYTGSVVGSSGLKTALIQIGSQGDVLILSQGETIGDSDWELTEISSEYVIFKAGKITKKLDLAK